MPVWKNCEECGTPIQAKPSQVHTRRFCSYRCKMVAQVRRQQAEGTWHKPTKPRRGTVTACPICLKPVYATATQRKSGMGVYCSQDCHNVSQRKGQVRKQCAYCGKPMSLQPSAAVRQFCSRDCMANGNTKRPLDRMHNGRRARLDVAGYVLLWEPSHPNKSLKGWVREHVLVAEATLGRYLENGEEVHHLNAVKDDNRPENLVVLGRSDHAAQTAANNWGRLKTDADELAEYRKRFGPLA